MHSDYFASELSKAKYSSSGYELKQVIETGQWAMFKSYKHDGKKVYCVIDDDWGIGNIDDYDTFEHRVAMAKEEMAYLMADAKAEFGF